jgi:hypothetical protein
MDERPDYPPRHWIDGLTSVEARLMTLVGEAVGPDAAAARRVADLLRGAMGFAEEDVRGNRPPDAPMTWADARYDLAACLRICLEVLDDPGTADRRAQ